MNPEVKFKHLEKQLTKSPEYNVQVIDVSGYTKTLEVNIVPLASFFHPERGTYGLYVLQMGYKLSQMKASTADIVSGYLCRMIRNRLWQYYNLKCMVIINLNGITD